MILRLSDILVIVFSICQCPGVQRSGAEAGKAQVVLVFP